MLHPTYYTLRTLLYFAQLQSVLEGKSVYNDTITNGTTDGYEICYGIFGCFDTRYPWVSSKRPVPSLPQSPDVIKTRVCLFTRKNPDTCQELQPYDTRGILDSNLKPNRPVHAIIHGFTEDGTVQWMKYMVKELLIYDDANVLTVDWGLGSMPPYSQATANCRVVGAYLGHLLYYLSHFGLSPSKYHIIGHSLGAHIAGYAGQFLQTQGFHVSRITGLDPAEPYFENTPPLVQLDPRDASFVDVIHTDGNSYLDILTNGPGKGLGTFMPSGHLDFYPNGGKTMPGCDRNWENSMTQSLGSFVSGLKNYIACNHIRAIEYFTESINSDCPFVGQECPSLDGFIAGDECLDNTARMGFHADQWISGHSPIEDNKRRTMFLQTKDKQPFCAYQFRVRISISEVPLSVKNGAESGSFSVTFEGSQDKLKTIISNEGDDFFEPENTYSFIIMGPYLGNITGMTLTWNHRVAMLNPFTWHSLLRQSKIYIHSMTVDSIESESRHSFCLCDHPLLSGEEQGFSATTEECPDFCSSAYQDMSFRSSPTPIVYPINET